MLAGGIRKNLHPLSGDTRRLVQRPEKGAGAADAPSSASTLRNGSGTAHPDAIERALAHGDSDKVRAAYHRGADWAKRVEMARWWSDYFDTLRTGAKIIPIEMGRVAI